MEVKVLYFQSTRKLTGVVEESVEMPESADVADLVCLIEEKYPGMKGLTKSLMIARDQAQKA